MYHPAFLDSATWDKAAALGQVSGIADKLKHLPYQSANSIPLASETIAFPLAPGRWLLTLPDHQRVILTAPGAASTTLGATAAQIGCAGDWQVWEVTSKSLNETLPVSSPCRPRTLGAVPRLGIGSRTTVLSWPSVFRVMAERKIITNPIQNSVGRELAPLADFLQGINRERYLPGLGLVPVGHTGSSVEGLWLEGVLTSITEEYNGPQYGADADHLPMHQTELLEEFFMSSRCYTFFTLDVGQLINWRAQGNERWESVVPVIAQAVAYIKQLRTEDFDLEISLDESPEEVAPHEAATTAGQMRELLALLEKVNIHPQYIAPHLGFTKGEDLPQADVELCNRLTNLHRGAREAGVILDVHSGDALSRNSRKLLGSILKGETAYKIAPIFQDILAEAMAQVNDPALSIWWKKTIETAQARGETLPESPIDIHHPVFHRWSFASFQKPPTRTELYAINDETKSIYDILLRKFLEDLIDDLELQPSKY